MSTTTTHCYATDEDLALIATGDVGAVFPADQVIASGVDGSFDPSDRWTLRSESVNFPDAGLAPGHVVRLVGPPERFRPPGLLLGVSAVSSNVVTLRRIGMGPGSGTPASPAEGISGVEFVATTLGPQLAGASRELDRLLGLDSIPLDPAGALRDAVARLVLARRYAMIAGGVDDAYLGRSALLRAEFDAMARRLALGGNPLGPSPAPRRGTRLVR
ncbi:hypothetical protein [Tautonia plasticadhaerens]|uniref:Uncharacterized protein n=1 Tax=Tautonia plasticadhaerens TaxID=2527974 RepID=A0A518HBS2_9BACT|nr:hypothetical protein [Tautonia plasticadhaerens]QDV38277.1 hypothetical protein ElP_62280 [Tautonia plasticadhaerens]